jgi:hypothetical protein
VSTSCLLRGFPIATVNGKDCDRYHITVGGYEVDIQRGILPLLRQSPRSRRTSRATFGSGVFGRCEAMLWASFRRAFANVLLMSVAVLWVYFQFGSSMLITMASFSVT